MKGFILLIASLGAFFFLAYSFHQEKLMYEEASALYENGQKEKDTLLKNKAYNDALDLSLKIKMETSSKNALIGSILTQLQEFPLAIYYYKKALKLDPQNAQLQKLVNELYPLVGLKIEESQVFIPRYLVHVFLIIFLASIAMKAPRWIPFLLFIPLAFFGALYLKDIYFSPIQGVIIRSSMLYQAPDAQAQLVSSLPIPSGLTVTVLDAKDGGLWLKIRTDEGVMGYLKEEAIRVLP